MLIFTTNMTKTAKEKHTPIYLIKTHRMTDRQTDHINLHFMAQSAASCVELHICSEIKCLKSKQEKKQQQEIQSSTKSRRDVLLKCIRELKIKKKMCFLL